MQGDGVGPAQDRQPTQGDEVVPVPDAQLVQGDVSSQAGSSGLLQPDVLAQLISAVIAGMAPIAKAAFAGQETSGDAVSRSSEDAASFSGAKKQMEAPYSLPWGTSCGGPKGVAIEGSVMDLPMPSGDIAMPLGEHFLQATRDKILRGECMDVFTLLYQEIGKKDKDLMD